MTPALVAAARARVGVTFNHQGRMTPQHPGLDCVGLVKIAYQACGVELQDVRFYAREPEPGAFRLAVAAALGAPVGGLPELGDVVMMRTKNQPHHLAIVGDHPNGGLSLIHSSGEAGKVVEQRLSAGLLDRITGVYRRPVEWRA